MSVDVSCRLQLRWMNGQIAGGFSKGKGHKSKRTLPLALTLGTDRVIPFFDFSELDGCVMASMDENEQLVFHEAGQPTDFELSFIE